MVSPRKPCLYFAKNACNNGDQCRFSHDASLASPLRSVCPYYLKGDCRYGDNCLNDHSMTGQELQPLLCKFFIKGECNKGSECVFRHDIERGILFEWLQPRTVLTESTEQVASQSTRDASVMMDLQSGHKGLFYFLLISYSNIDGMLSVSSNSRLSPLGNFDALQLNSTPANSSPKTNSGEISILPWLHKHFQWGDRIF